MTTQALNANQYRKPEIVIAIDITEQGDDYTILIDNTDIRCVRVEWRRKARRDAARDGYWSWYLPTAIIERMFEDDADIVLVRDAAIAFLERYCEVNGLSSLAYSNSRVIASQFFQSTDLSIFDFDDV